MTRDEEWVGVKSQECRLESGEGEEKYECRLTKYEGGSGYHTPAAGGRSATASGRPAGDLAEQGVFGTFCAFKKYNKPRRKKAEHTRQKHNKITHNTKTPHVK
jgi:hypothetical protein